MQGLRQTQRNSLILGILCCAQGLSYHLEESIQDFDLTHFFPLQDSGKVSSYVLHHL